MSWIKTSNKYPPLEERVLCFRKSWDEIDIGYLVDENEEKRESARKKEKYPQKLIFHIGSYELNEKEFQEDIPYWHSLPELPKEMMFAHLQPYPVDENLIDVKTINGRQLFFFEKSMWELVDVDKYLESKGTWKEIKT